MTLNSSTSSSRSDELFRFFAFHGLRASEDGPENLLLDDLTTQRVLSEVAFD